VGKSWFHAMKNAQCFHVLEIFSEAGPHEFLHRPFCWSKVMRWIEKAIRTGRAVTGLKEGELFCRLYIPTQQSSRGLRAPP
jgi:hypothetical protein